MEIETNFGDDVLESVSGNVTKKVSVKILKTRSEIARQYHILLGCNFDKRLFFVIQM
ncbi:hypothetical protein Hanom_Chr04g00324341 [Helianthus anomalus]